jgi:MbtH protein
MNHTHHANAALPQHARDPRSSEAHLIVVNGQGQHSIWPATLPVPAGWQQKGQAMPKDSCLAVIAA